MFKGYRIIDADSHVIEPPAMWKDYLDPEFRDFTPSSEMRIKGEDIVEKVSREVWQDANAQMKNAHPNAYLQGYNVESHLQEMIVMGVDLAFLYPTYGLWLWAIDSLPPDVAGGFTSAYNRWLRDFCSFDPDRLKGIGAINLHNPETMAAEVRQIAEWGWKGVFLRPNPVKGRLLSDRAYEPFWTECEALGLAVGIHEGSHSRLPTTGSDRFNSRFAMHACSHPMEQMMAMLALIEGGVLERHPGLRIAFLESGCGWLPYWLWRLDEEYENLYWEVKETVKMKPSEYFRRQCFISIEPSEAYLKDIIKYISTDNLIFGSDYPHMDHKPENIMELVAMGEKGDRELVQKILWDNPARFYGLV
ncbi:MAG: amidohydrolase family protein [Cyanobacteria bacterium P01_E01_bin.42]